MIKVGLCSNKQKIKMKKNANEFVDIDAEKKIDPKYKTELCKSFSQTNFCVYGNKCRFAHGEKELTTKNLNAIKYKIKDCLSFNEHGFCMYGKRCNFKHNETKLSEVKRSFYNYKMNTYHLNNEENFFGNFVCKKTRLNVFEKFNESVSLDNSTQNESDSDYEGGNNSISNSPNKNDLKKNYTPGYISHVSLNFYAPPYLPMSYNYYNPCGHSIFSS